MLKQLIATFNQNLYHRSVRKKNSIHVFLDYREEHSAKKAIISYVQEIKLRGDSLAAHICHLVNMAKCTQTLFEYKINLTQFKKILWG